MALDPKIDAYLARLSSTATPMSLVEMRAATETSLGALHGPLEDVADVRTYLAPATTARPARARLRRRARRPAPCCLRWCMRMAEAGSCARWNSMTTRAARWPMPPAAWCCPWTAAGAGAQVPGAGRGLLLRAALGLRAGRHAGVDPARIAVGGDSAGGNLAAAAAIMARDRGGPRIAHQLLCYPVLDHSFSTDSYRAYGQNFFLTEETMRYCWFTYLLNEQDGDSPYASPLRAADLTACRRRPCWYASTTALRDEGEAYARRLREAGVDACDHRLPGMVHACIHMLGLTPAARHLFELAGGALRALSPSRKRPRRTRLQWLAGSARPGPAG